MVQLPRKAKGQRPHYFTDPAIDKLLSITMALAGEVSVLRDRLASVELMLERGEKVSPEAVDKFLPDAPERVIRDERREQFLEIILKSLHDDVESMRVRSSANYEDVVSEVAAK